MAAEARVWFVERNPRVRRQLLRLCPGATFQEWEAGPPTPGKIAEAVRAIRDALEKLEAEHAPPPRYRFLIGFVDMQREAETVLAEEQWFHRAPGESGDKLCQRARRAVGWED